MSFALSKDANGEPPHSSGPPISACRAEEIDRRLPVLFQGTATLTALSLPRPRFQASTRVAQEFGAGHPPHKERDR